MEGLIKDKPHLMVVPTGPLTALPVHLLVTEKSAAPDPDGKDFSAYRDAAWLLKRQAVTVLPSVASLKALRVFARNERGAKPLVGFGDPVFGADGRCTMASVKQARRQVALLHRLLARRGARPRLLGGRCRGSRRPPTSSKPWRKLGAPTSDIYLREAARQR